MDPVTGQQVQDQLDGIAAPSPSQPLSPQVEQRLDVEEEAHSRPVSPKGTSQPGSCGGFKPPLRVAGPRPAGQEHPAESAGGLVRKNSSQMVFAHSHGHAQWRTIAEEFSSLLNADFVDLVFKVRGRPGVLAAHRSLVAAAWPVLRDGLRRLEGPPPREVREAGLTWLAAPQGAEANEGQPVACQTPGSRAENGKSPAPARDAAASGSPSPDSPRKSLPEGLNLDECPGVLDVTSQMWGSYSLLKALLCHLYSRPVMVYERELPSLRVAALNLGSTELAKCCDDVRPGGHRVERSREQQSQGPARPDRPETPELAQEAAAGGPGTLCDLLARCPSGGVGAVGGSSTSFLSGGGGSGSTSAASINVNVVAPEEQPSATSREKEATAGKGALGSTPVSLPQQTQTLSVDTSRVPDVSPKIAGPGALVEGSPTTEWAVRVVSRNTTNPSTEGSDARLHPAAVAVKAWGERSQNFDKAPGGGEKPLADSIPGQVPTCERGGVRRVLSEIKRNMVESSRIIADKTFQQMYEMVPGERGILGEGINGPVRMAKHRKTGREVAVKRISCVNLSEQRRQMLVSEVRIFLQVSHRNIVQLLEVYESEVDQAVLLVMELCTGKELFERLAERRWYSEFDAARVAKQMLDAVSYLHSQNICHRDLKLENWLYENPSHEAKLKLCDFGFGQIVEPSVQLTATLGSLFYVAPEVLEGSYGLPCDMWSVGVIVYMLLSGVPPFDGKTDGDVMSKIRGGRFVSTGKRWEGISETAKHFVRSMLRKDPYERMTAIEAGQHAWLKMECQVKPYSWPKGGPDAEMELPIDRGVIRDMWKFAQNNAITRAALGMLAKLNTSFGGREEDVVLLEQRFKSHDEQNTGKIDAEAFIQVLKETLHLQISSAEEKQFFMRIAESHVRSEDPHSGTVGAPERVPEQKGRRRREVNYSEFITLTKARRMANNTAAIREAFRAMDVAGDGYIKEDDMHSLLGDEFKSTIENYVDVNGKDFIDYVHFASIVSQEISKKDSVQPSAEAPKEAAGNAQEPAAPAPTASDSGGSPPAPSGSDAPCQASPQSASEAMAISIGSPVPSGDGQPAIKRGLSALQPEEEQREVSEPRSPGFPPNKERSSEAKDENKSNSEMEKTEAPGEGESEDDEELNEELDADAMSDEEQLVNVKKESTVIDEAIELQADNPKPKPPMPAKDSKASFSLSLAGSAEYDDVNWGSINRVMSMPSDVYNIRQLPGFHSRTLRPFYAARPVSNVVMGLIRGTSLYAKQSVAARLATIIHTTCGWFFIMPNPKYHTEVDTRKGLLSKETGKFRFVAWWIHPRFVPQLRQWFERLTYEGLDQERQEQRREARAQHEVRPHKANEAPAAPRCAEGRTSVTGRPDGVQAGGVDDVPGAAGIAGAAAPAPSAVGGGLPGAEAGLVDTAPVQASLRRPEVQKPVPPQPELEMQKSDVAQGVPGEHIGMGSPGDFRFSDVPKPENYLHTYRDLHTREHVNMLTQLNDGTHRFLRSLFDENFMAHAQISAGFHYPVRTQYATLHMQLRVNSGSVCREDGRGIEVDTLIENMKRDRSAYERDAETLRYHVTENVKVSLLAAAEEHEEKNPGECAKRHISPLVFELGVTAMPTIHDEGEEDEDGETTDESRRNTKVTRGVTSTAAADVAAAAAGGDAAGEVQDPEAMCAGAGLDDGEEEEAPASYLVNLQPSVGSKFWKVIYERRERCAQAFGTDPTYLYPLHISVTGFFEAYRSQVEKLVVAMRDLLHGKENEDASNVSVGKVICTKTGYVLFDMQASSITAFAQRLGERSSRELGIHIRPKAVNHISLACNRPDEETRTKIKAMYEAEEDGAGAEVAAAYAEATFDVVLSRLLARSSFERMAEDGPHRFMEIARLKVPVRPVSAAAPA